MPCSLTGTRNCVSLIAAKVEHFIHCAACLPTFSRNIWALVELFEFFVYLGFICPMNSLQCFFFFFLILNSCLLVLVQKKNVQTFLICEISTIKICLDWRQFWVFQSAQAILLAKLVSGKVDTTTSPGTYMIGTTGTLASFFVVGDVWWCQCKWAYFCFCLFCCCC